MTEPSAPQSPKSRRSKGREPQTIDLSATVVGESGEPSAGEARRDEARPEPTAGTEKEAPKTVMNEKSPTSDKAAPQKIPERKTKSLSVGTVLAGLAFGLIGGIAGTVLMQGLTPVAPSSSPQLEARIAALDAQIKSLQANGGNLNDSALNKLSGLDAEQQALRKSLQATLGKVDALTRALATGSETNAIPQEIGQRIDALDQRLTKTLADMQATIGNARNQMELGQDALAPLGSRIDALEKQAAASAKQSADPLPAIRFVLTARLQQAVAGGKPFVETLNALRKTGVTEADIADIAVFASSGAPTSAQLQAEFTEPAQAMVNYERSLSGEGFTDRLLRMSERVIKVRPRDNPEAKDLASMVVRIETALDRNAFIEAAQLWNALPDTAKQFSAIWGKRLNERANAAAALSRLEEKAILSLESSVR